MRFLGRHDAGYYCSGKYRAFFGLDFLAVERGDNRRWKIDYGPGSRLAIRRGLVANVDHRWPVGVIDMAQLSHLATNPVHLDFALGMRLGDIGTAQFTVAIRTL